MTPQDTLTQLTGLQQAIAEAAAQLAAPQTQLTTSVEQLEGEFDELISHAQSLLEQINGAKDSLATDADELIASLNDAHGQLEALQTEIPEEVAATQSGIAEFNQQLDAISQGIEATVPALEQSVSGLTEKAEQTEQALQQMLSEAQESLTGTLSSDIQSHQAAIAQRVETLQTFVTSECLPTLTSKATEFAAHLDDVIEKLTAKLQDLGTETEQKTQASLDQMTQDIEDKVFGDLIKTADDLEQLAQRLSQAIDTTSTSVGTSKDLLLTGMSTTNIGVNAVIGIFQELQEFFDRI